MLMSKVEVAPELADVAARLDVGFVLTAVRVASVMVLVTPCDATTTMEVPTWVTIVTAGTFVLPMGAVVIVVDGEDFDPGDAVVVVLAAVVVVAADVAVVLGAIVEVTFVDAVLGSVTRTATPWIAASNLALVASICETNVLNWAVPFGAAVACRARFLY